MKLTFKGYVPGDVVNGNGSANGAWLFAQIDMAALTHINEEFLCDMPDVLTVTNGADIKFKSPAFAYGYIEVWTDIIDATPGSISISTLLKYRDTKSKTFNTCVEGVLKFTLINKNRNIVRIPKEVINAIKR